MRLEVIVNRKVSANDNERVGNVWLMYYTVMQSRKVLVRRV